MQAEVTRARETMPMLCSWKPLGLWVIPLCGPVTRFERAMLSQVPHGRELLRSGCGDKSLPLHSLCTSLDTPDITFSGKLRAP